MIVSRIDPEARSTHAAAKGFRALCEGDTVLAREKYAEAGEILERGSKRDVPAADKHLLRFLAASQYYHGGEYQRAAKLVAKINRGHLRPGDRPTLDQFRKDIEERADPQYPARVRLAVFAAWKQGRWDAGIDLLQRHPFVVERSMLAWLRADLCCMSGRLKAAALFSADAIRFSSFHPTPVVLRAGAPLVLEFRGRGPEAAQYIELILEHAPTPLDWVTAAAALLPDVQRSDVAAAEELLRRFERARSVFPSLPATTAHDPDVRSWMSHGFFLAVLTTDQLKGREAALTLLGEAEAFGPTGVYIDIIRILRSDNGEWLKKPEVLKLASEGPFRLQDQRSKKSDASFATAA